MPTGFLTDTTRLHTFHYHCHRSFCGQVNGSDNGITFYTLMLCISFQPRRSCLQGFLWSFKEIDQATGAIRSLLWDLWSKDSTGLWHIHSCFTRKWLFWIFFNPVSCFLWTKTFDHWRRWEQNSSMIDVSKAWPLPHLQHKHQTLMNFIQQCIHSWT